LQSSERHAAGAGSFLLIWPREHHDRLGQSLDLPSLCGD
jgi:hypothetical protein